jgi:hypothetical protein
VNVRMDRGNFDVGGWKGFLNPSPYGGLYKWRVRRRNTYLTIEECHIRLIGDNAVILASPVSTDDPHSSSRFQH